VELSLCIDFKAARYGGSSLAGVALSAGEFYE
jgi:hypothetical protein